MKKTNNPVAKKPALKALVMKQSAKPKTAAQSSPKAKPAKTLVPATPPKPAAKPVNANSSQAELTQVVARLSRTADKLAQVADRLTASAEKLGSAADTLAEATRQAAQRQDAPTATLPLAEEPNTSGEE